MMIKQQVLENRKSKPVEVFMEPYAESFVLEPGQKAVLVLHYDGAGVPITIAVDDDDITIYEEMGTSIHVFVGEKMVYASLDF